MVSEVMALRGLLENIPDAGHDERNPGQRLAAGITDAMP
jgi:hypothetical protein